MAGHDGIHDFTGRTAIDLGERELFGAAEPVLLDKDGMTATGLCLEVGVKGCFTLLSQS